MLLSCGKPRQIRFSKGQFYAEISGLLDARDFGVLQHDAFLWKAKVFDFLKHDFT